MVDLDLVFDYIKRPFDMGFWKRNTGGVQEVKKDNRSSVTSSRTRQSILSNRQSLLSNSSKVPPWEVIVDQHLTQCLRAAKSRDFTYFRLSAALSAKPEAEQVDYKATLLCIINDAVPIHQLEDLNKSKCEVIRNSFKEYVSEVEKGRDEQLDWLAWGRLLDSEEERVVEVITAKIKETNEKAKNIIKDLPLDARDNAAGVWVQGSGFAMGTFRALCSQITLVSGRVGEFERGEFGIISQAEEKIQSAVDAGVLAISNGSKDTTDFGNDLD